MSKKRLDQINKQIENIKSQLQELELFRPGSLTQQYSNPKEKTGAFYQLSYTHQMKSRTEYVRKQFAPKIRKQVGNYRRFKKLVDKWIQLGIEYSKLEMKLEVKQLIEKKSRRSRKNK